MVRLTIKGKLPNLNDYTKACRANKFAGAQMKKKAERVIAAAVEEQQIEPISGKVRLKFCWYEANKRRDLDNICFAKKFILDALVETGIIEADGWNVVCGFVDEFYISKDPRIEVYIWQVYDGAA